jgi:hypothetical protein
MAMSKTDQMADKLAREMVGRITRDQRKLARTGEGIMDLVQGISGVKDDLDRMPTRLE